KAPEAVDGIVAVCSKGKPARQVGPEAILTFASRTVQITARKWAGKAVAVVLADGIRHAEVTANFRRKTEQRVGLVVCRGADKHSNGQKSPPDQYEHPARGVTRK